MQSINQSTNILNIFRFHKYVKLFCLLHGTVTHLVHVIRTWPLDQQWRKKVRNNNLFHKSSPGKCCKGDNFTSHTIIWCQMIMYIMSYLPWHISWSQAQSFFTLDSELIFSTLGLEVCHKWKRCYLIELKTLWQKDNLLIIDTSSF